ncbi:bifunctional [glutamine synthetase] adenylyltransferase/[glutamine synthetase]-adenylyl-L-tyrosine phosphorylase [Oceanicella actignis]|uniref:Bifunctional glutamine synthetase adenylyltransferase/adenylyl-removing enzyme n=1 Tax=Oceanicella actignis TaxID=1189325 RepID=A0A1M7S9T5_9RHOB|nr:bifunctional [glutamine synthetase] adenylyltransferase/[glutamine synthetase]-adenylyl-L-tyrosine phosphorylase [Oceanicella actignis]SET30350.1 glutamate-ammonia-ligase adenylyltransferase [Oceanicella actignis]SHN55241.1 glutamate-ammonia-ligase adenylyltransferase [Oceanicella actignis]
MTATSPSAPTARPLADRIRRLPRAHDPRRGAEAWAALDLDPALRPLIEGAAGSSPYLQGLMRAEGAWLSRALAAPPEQAMAEILDQVRAMPATVERPDRGPWLRRAKRRAALLIALCDLAGAWSLEETTGALSDLADAAVDAALRALVADEAARGRLPGPDEDPGGCAGLTALAMGKGGARELNYSSDIDLIFLFDESRYGARDALEARARLIKVCQQATRLLSQPTGEGYVFRVDLRLRPDPSTTPVCVSMGMAEQYYESLGRTWERAAYIKARAAAGDVAAGEAFLRRLTPFIWRKHLDYAAIGDAQGIRERIRAHRGVGGPIRLPGHDMKLGRGGIREIEFFVQTRQLICGGRDPSLRARATRKALAALTEAGWVGEDERAALDAAYVAHREIEHRLQMIEDAQTHVMPVSAEARARVAALCGREDQAAWEAEIMARLETVDRLTEPFFTPGPRQAAPAADAEALAAMGFARPDAAEATLMRWRDGEIPATRNARARELLGRLEPLILRSLSRAAQADEALAHFDRFLSGLPAGVQILSLFESNPALLDLIAQLCAAAPRLAEHLGRNAQVLDALLDRDFFEPLPAADALRKDLAAALAAEQDYERKLDRARRWRKEAAFRVGVQLLRGLADPAEAARGFSAIAEACLQALLPEVEAEFARRHGPPPGRGAAILAMGKLGSAEMTAGSDLDLILLYDAAGQETSEGPRPLAASAYFSRFAQALISAVSAKTAEGALYEIDMRLRPSGRQGMVATSLAGFEDYQRAKAWTWEHMALTRARAVAGRADLMADVDEAVARALSLPRDEAATLADAARMRARVAAAHGARRADPWDVKHAAGGLMDIDFVAQAGALILGRGRPAGAEAAIAALAEAGRLGADEAEALIAARRLQSAVQQLTRVALDGDPRPEAFGAELRGVLCRATGAADVAALEARLAEAQARAAAAADRFLPAPAPEAG